MESAPTINIARAGQVIPLKFRITDASGDSGLKNQDDGYYQFNWHTSKDYVGSCRITHLYLGEGQGIASTALFQFAR